MEPLFGFLLFAAVSVIVAVVASKRGRSGWLVFLFCAVAGLVLVPITSQAGGGGLAAGVVAFLAPAVAFVWVLSSQSSEQLAVSKGEHGEFRKCPFCAESVRREAVKCKHCGSDLTTQVAGAKEQSLSP